MPGWAVCLWPLVLTDRWHGVWLPMQRVKNSTMYVSCACIRVGVCSTLVPVCVLVLTAACAFVHREHLATAYNVTMQTQQLVRRHVWLWARRNSVMWAFHTFWNAGPNLYE